MAEHLRLAKTDSPPQAGGFVMTDTARDILRSLSLVRQFGGAAMTMIAGAPGVGKSEALKRYAEENGTGCIYIPRVSAGDVQAMAVAEGFTDPAA